MSDITSTSTGGTSGLGDSRVATLREQLPVLASVIFLNTGTTGPMPHAVADAMAADIGNQRRYARSGPEHGDHVRELRTNDRAAMARIFGCTSDEVALTHNTTEGMNLVTMGVNWQPGDEAVTTNVEHPGVLYPLYAASERFNITMKTADVRGRSPDEVLERITKLITPRTKLVSLSHVSFQTGQLLPIAEICEVAHARGALVFVDGAQNFGAITLDMAALGCDAYAASGQKWLCGPEGTGALFVSQDAVSQLRIIMAGYGTMESHNDYGGYAVRGNAQRFFEQGTTNSAGFAGQLAAAQWLCNEVGIDRAADRSFALAERAMAGFVENGLEVVTPASHAGLVTAVVGDDPDPVVAALREQKIAVRSIRQLGAVRLSVGYFNTADEIDAAVKAIAAAREA